MRIKELHVSAEFRKCRDNNYNGNLSKVLVFEDADCNTFEVTVRDDSLFSTCDSFTKAEVYDLALSLVTGTSKTGSHYEILSPAFSDFVRLHDGAPDY